MTSASPTLALARRLGTILGLSGGLDGPATLRMTAGDHAAFLDVFRAAREFAPEQYDRYLAEFSALHLPSLLRTFLNNPITAFDAINPSFFDSYASLVGVHVPSLGSDRFIREHPAEAIQLRAKALSFILDWSDKVKILPDSIWLDVMEDLVLLYGNLTVAESVSQDTAQAGPDPLSVSAEVRSRLRTRLQALETLQARVKGKDRAKYAATLEFLRAVVSPGEYRLVRGSELIDKLVEGGNYFHWWACEGRRRDFQTVEPCKEADRDQLRTCARCLQARYCSEMHQKADWKFHKLSCVAPTW